MAVDLSRRTQRSDPWENASHSSVLHEQIQGGLALVEWRLVLGLPRKALGAWPASYAVDLGGLANRKCCKSRPGSMPTESKLLAIYYAMPRQKRKGWCDWLDAELVCHDTLGPRCWRESLSTVMAPCPCRAPGTTSSHVAAEQRKKPKVASWVGLLNELLMLSSGHCPGSTSDPAALRHRHPHHSPRRIAHPACSFELERRGEECATFPHRQDS